jgi:gliding motility-associated-like protein
MAMILYKTIRNCLPIILTGLGLFIQIQVQSQYLSNPSLESKIETDDITQISGWSSFDAWADPDFYFTYQPPGNDSVVYLPVNGKSFALFRARGESYIADDTYPANTREYLYQKLLVPLKENSCFEFKASLCYNPNYIVKDYINPDTAFPVRLQVWGGNKFNDRGQLLVETEPVSNTNWKEYTFIFTTFDQSITYILIEVQWDLVDVFPKPYCGHILIDNLSLKNIENPAEIVTHHQIFSWDKKTFLTPDNEGIGYRWVPEEFVSVSFEKSPYMTDYTDTVKVYISRENECPIIEVFYLEPDCKSRYPNGELDTVNFYYKFEEGLKLTASEGVSWNWEPPTNLSETNIQSPILTGYQEFYTVHILDKYSCETVENFHLYWNCDTLYPGGELIILDKIITQHEDYKLETFIGKPVSDWSPPDFLSCVKCLSPVASPRSSITYSIILEDEFKCIHTEKFIFNIPLKIPNVITPNGDGFNDCFIVMGLPENTTFHLFDKAGNNICTIPFFETIECWDGNRENLKSGTYWYAFENPESGTLAKGYILIKR